MLRNSQNPTQPSPTYPNPPQQLSAMRHSSSCLTSLKFVPFSSSLASSTSALSAPAMALLPMQESLKRVGSSLVNIMTSRLRLGLKSCAQREQQGRSNAAAGERSWDIHACTTCEGQRPHRMLTQRASGLAVLVPALHSHTSIQGAHAHATACGPSWLDGAPLRSQGPFHLLLEPSPPLGRLTARLSAASASIAPMTPSVPSYMPASGMASQCDPVSTEPKEGSDPSQRPKMFPMESSLQQPTAQHSTAGIRSLSVLFSTGLHA